jgi:hypothetical protein
VSRLAAVEIGFVFPRPFGGPIRHNSFSTQNLSLSIAERRLGLFRTFGQGGTGGQQGGRPAGGLSAIRSPQSGHHLGAPVPEIGFVWRACPQWQRHSRPCRAAPCPTGARQIGFVCTNTLPETPQPCGPSPGSVRVAKLASFFRSPLVVQFVITPSPEATCLSHGLSTNWVRFADLSPGGCTWAPRRPVPLPVDVGQIGFVLHNWLQRQGRGNVAPCPASPASLGDGSAQLALFFQLSTAY